MGDWAYVRLTMCFICHHPCLYCILLCLHLVRMLFAVVIPTSFLYFVGKVFCLVSVSALIFSEDGTVTDNSTQPLPTENSGEFDSLQPLVA